MRVWLVCTLFTVKTYFIKKYLYCYCQVLCISVLGICQCQNIVLEYLKKINANLKTYLTFVYNITPERNILLNLLCILGI